MKKVLWMLLIVAYVILALFGFLTGMFSEGLIGCEHPMADFLADAMVWLGVAISMSAVVCPLMSLRMKEHPSLRRIVLATPFLLLAVQIVLNGMAEKL